MPTRFLLSYDSILFCRSSDFPPALSSSNKSPRYVRIIRLTLREIPALERSLFFIMIMVSERPLQPFLAINFNPNGTFNAHAVGSFILESFFYFSSSRLSTCLSIRLSQLLIYLNCRSFCRFSPLFMFLPNTYYNIIIAGVYSKSWISFKNRKVQIVRRYLLFEL